MTAASTTPSASSSSTPSPLTGPLLCAASMICVQSGAALSTEVMNVLGAPGTTWLRLCFAAFFLVLISRPKFHLYSKAQWKAAIMLGVAMAAMSLCYFEALMRIPLGLATSIDFLGPLAVAVAGMNRARHLIWPLLAAIGVLMLVHNGAGWTVDLVGAGFALGAAVGWASYIILSKRVGSVFSGLQGLAMSFMVAAIASLPFGIGGVVAGATPFYLLAVAALAVLVPLLPYALEMTALRRMSTRAFGVLMSAEPAIGALCGLALLGQQLSWLQYAGILCVTAASIGAVAEK
ncbi:MAG: EamA family transporter [Rhodospirillaceae bacterium]|nr:MAG: EamA family transporter [Rhodospirillaceae bacterium]